MTKKRFLICDSSETHFGYRVHMDSLDVSAFRENPVLLREHDPKDVVGRWVNISLENGALYAEAEFMENEELKTFRDAVEKDFIKAASAGIARGQFYKDDDDQYWLKDGVIIEGSIVSLPANPNALVQQLYDGDSQKLSTATIIKMMAIPDTNEKTKDEPKTDDDMKFSDSAYQRLGLNSGANEVQIEAAILKLHSDKLEAEQKLKSYLAAETNTMIATAIQDGRIPATDREHYERLAATDLALCRNTLDKLPKAKLLSAELTPAAEGREKWTYDDWIKNDYEGLLALSTTNPARFKELTTI